jgi:hypothetical protein
MHMTPQTRRAPLALRLLYALPFLGQIARDIARERDSIYYALTIFVTLVILAVSTWGLVALTMIALTMVPVVFVLLIAITQG